jgi:hypothetical protein
MQWYPLSSLGFLEVVHLNDVYVDEFFDDGLIESHFTWRQAGVRSV